ncbi:MAG TPA: amidohydrolase family protein, partial [Casimicrobiaceae bacterium]
MAAYLFSGGRLLDPRASELHEGVEVLVEGNRVKEVSDRPIATQSAMRVDLRGRTLMPGLIDAHVHFILAEVNIGLLDGMPLTLLTTKAAVAARRMLMRGFTTVRDAGGSDYGMKT